jgi:hypothetical protein
VSPLVGRLYRLALLSMPESIRARHGEAMVALFEREVSRAGKRSRIAGALAAVAGIADAVRRGLYERARPSVRRTPSPASPGHDPVHRPASSSGEPFMSGLLYDVRFALRVRRKTEGRIPPHSRCGIPVVAKAALVLQPIPDTN